MKKRLLTILLATAMMLLIPAAVFAEGEDSQTPGSTDSQAIEQAVIVAGWNADRTQYIGEDGKPVTGLFKAKMSDDVGALFYADENGNVVKTQGLITVDYPNKRYLCTKISGGHVGFREVGAVDKNSYTYLVGEEGAIVETATIYNTAEGKVIVQDNGTVLKKAGFVDVNGARYYVKSSGYMKTNSGWIRVNSKKYRVGEGGVIRTKVGSFKVGKYRYVIPEGSDGALRTSKGVVSANSKLYYVRNAKGQLGVYRSYTVGSKVCHVNKNGVVKVGRHKWKDKKYYYSTKKGFLKTKGGMITQSGKRFFVKKGGLVIVNKKFRYKKKVYIAGSNGVLKTGMFSWRGTKYYANSKGMLKSEAGMIEYEGNDYFVWGGGEVAVNKMFYWNGKLYAADGEGHLLTGLFKRGNTYYFADADHSVRTSEEIFKYKNNYYFNKRGGGLARNEWVDFGGKHYYAGDNAAFRVSAFTISGVTFHPANNGVISDEEYKKLFPDPADDEGDDVEDVD